MPNTDSPACTGEGVRADLGWALGVVFRAYVREAECALADLAGGPRGYQVLATVVHDQPGSQLAMAQRLGVDRTVMTYLLDDLEKAGLVARRPDPQDRRARRVEATEAGRGRLAELEGELRRAEDRVLSGLSAADGETFRALLRHVVSGLDQPDHGKDPCTVVEEETSPRASRH
jgi:DNA-binding MarR family transcriptional regulator